MSVQTFRHVNPDSVKSTRDWGHLIWKAFPWVMLICWLVVISSWIIHAMVDTGTVMH